MRQELLRGGSDVLTLRVFDYGRPAAVTAVTARLFDHSGQLIDSGDAPDGVFTPAAGVVGQVRQDCSVEWSYTDSRGMPHRTLELFDVVLFKLYPVATEADLIREAPSLVASERVMHAVADDVHFDEGQGETTITSSALMGTREDWRGSILTFASGESLIVDEFSPVTGTIVVPGQIVAATGDEFTLRRSYQGELDAAWEDIYDKLIQQCATSPGGVGSRQSRPYLIMSPAVLRRPHILLALDKAFRGIATDATGVDWARAERYLKEFDQIWNGLNLVFASDADGDSPVPDGERSAQWGFNR